MSRLTKVRRCGANSTLFFIGAVCIAIAGCGGAVSSPHGKRAGVRGRVFLDGKPLERATIVFVPVKGEQTVVATGTVRAGAFEIPSEHGPLVGEMRVEIRSETLDFEEFEATRKEAGKKSVPPKVIEIPARYNKRSKLTAKVSEDPGHNQFQFLLESKPGNDRQRR